MRAQLILVAISVALVCASAEEPKSEYLRARRRIEERLKGVDLGPSQLDELKALGDEFRRQWREADTELYGRATLYLAQKVASHNFRDPRKEGIRQALAMQALEIADRMPIEVECRLVFQLQRFVDAEGKELPGTDRWPEARRRMAALWLHAWKRVEQAFDAKWDPEKRPVAMPFVPEVGRTGVPPESVRDPEVRARYEKAIAENEEKKRAYALQAQLRDIMQWFPGEAERFLKEAYTTPPAAVKECEELVGASLANTEAAKRLLRIVKGE